MLERASLGMATWAVKDRLAPGSILPKKNSRSLSAGLAAWLMARTR